jgi:hypothetical protein
VNRRIVVIEVRDDDRDVVRRHQYARREFDGCEVLFAIHESGPLLEYLTRANERTLSWMRGEHFPMLRLLGQQPGAVYAFLSHDQQLASPNWADVPGDVPAIVPWMSYGPHPLSGVAVGSIPVKGWLANEQAIQAFTECLGFPTFSDFVHDNELWKSVRLCAPTAFASAERESVNTGRRSLSRTSTVLAIIPHRDCQEFLPRCLETITTQTRLFDAVCVIDDSSERDVRSIVSCYSGVTLLESPMNVGPYELIQQVITDTRFDAYCLLDADDFCTADRLERLLMTAESYGAEMVGSHELRFTDDHSHDVFPGRYPQDVNRAFATAPSYSLLHGSSIISRELIHRIGGFAGLKFGADFEFLARAAFAGRIVNADCHAYMRRVRTNSLTNASETGLGSDERQQVHAAVAARWAYNVERRRQGAVPNLTPVRAAVGVSLQYVLGPGISRRRAPAVEPTPRRVFDTQQRYIAKPPTSIPWDSAERKGLLAAIVGYTSLTTPWEAAQSLGQTRGTWTYREEPEYWLDRLGVAFAMGLLVPESEVVVRMRASKEGPIQQISAACVVTNAGSHSVRKLLRATASLVNNMRDYGRATPVHVYSDCRSEQDVRTIKAALSDFARTDGADVRLADVRQKALFAEKLAREAQIPVSLAHLALLGDRTYLNTVGANRNCLLLDGVGRRVVSIDDDVHVNEMVASAHDDRVSITSDGETSTWIDDSVTFTPYAADMLALHEAVLGGTAWTQIRERHWDGERLSDRLRLLTTEGSGSVRISYLGCHGDCAMPSAATLLTLTGPGRRRLLASAQTYEKALSSRALTRISKSLLITDNIRSCFGLAHGVDATSLLPPFFPVLTGEDFLFAHMTLLCDRSAVFAHVPVAVKHNADVGRPYSRDLALEAGRESHLLSVLGAILSRQTDGRGDGRHDLSALGRSLMNIGDMASTDFAEYLDDIIRTAKSQYLEHMHGLLRRYGFGPMCWSRDVIRQLDRVEATVNSPNRLLPTDAPAGCTSDDLQTLIRLYGELLTAWPNIWNAAKTLSARGVRISEVLNGKPASRTAAV